MTEPAATVLSAPGLRRWGLRAKTIALVLGATGLCGVFALVVSHFVIQDIRTDLGVALARENAFLTQQRAQATVGLELALSRRLAESLVLRAWLSDEENPDHRARFFEEGENFRRAFASKSYFVASETSRRFYYSDPDHAPTPAIGYTLQREAPTNAWYFATLAQPDGLWINVDHDKTFDVTNVWINVMVRDAQGRPLGVVGTGISLGRFVEQVLGTSHLSVTTMIVDTQGAVVAHPDPSRMEFDLAGKARAEKTVFSLFASSQDREQLKALMTAAHAKPDSVFTAVLGGETLSRMVAVAAVPSLDWLILASVDPQHRPVLTPRRLLIIGSLAGVLLLSLALATGLGFDRLVLRPLADLSRSLRRVGTGEYDLPPLSSRQDELGELTRAFDGMARQVRAHSDHLEHLVSERTHELMAVHARLSDTHRLLTDSVRYASLIQRAILPDRLLEENCPGSYFVLWRPRDVVGGDFYVYRANQRGCLFGVVDCAGHGVPGACMTMIAHAALEVALRDGPPDDPAGLLARTDAVARSMLPASERDARVATSIDMGLVFVALDTQTLTFAGAHLSLLWSHGGESGEIPGDRRGLNDRKPGHYTNTTLPLVHGRTYYLVTDGLLDQAGGAHGFGFGPSRFRAWMNTHADLALDLQKASLEQTLDAYRGDQGQRDDITVLAFRFESSA
ncbi:biofilm regulation protein phosphatase SiaA [Pararhodospirillum photometricum]|uniref:Serine phosphatase RsbU n=1 Tax=Pararhodospirillum photometricum DSM 122 TaxID=1150469 RepID=H6SMF7_PARPM|nr:biofilm regulation protein phosphatase SiaA [Pararhodospirillum photometricum]CCG06840.1 Serine phosphatase RsbU [Pararhodospirillum photometricum DSM 122]